MNAFAERFVESAKSECLERIVPLGEGHLRAAVQAFVEHYHEERPHQGLGNELIRAQDHVDRHRSGQVPCAGLAGCSSSIIARPRSPTGPPRFKGSEPGYRCPAGRAESPETEVSSKAFDTPICRHSVLGRVFTPDGVKSRAPRGWARFLVTTAPGS